MKGTKKTPEALLFYWYSSVVVLFQFPAKNKIKQNISVVVLQLLCAEQNVGAVGYSAAWGTVLRRVILDGVARLLLIIVVFV